MRSERKGGGKRKSVPVLN